MGKNSTQKILGYFRNSLILLCCWAMLPTNSGTSASPQLPLVFPDPTNSPVTYDTEPLNMKMLEDTGLQKNAGVITHDSIERFPEFRKIMPSLWWTQDQFPAQKKLITKWLAYPQKKRIDLVLNPQYWNNLDYLDRYHLINRYGLTARRYGYNVRIFNLNFSEAQPIVAYTCASKAAACYIQWQEINQRNLRLDSAK